MIPAVEIPMHNGLRRLARGFGGVRCPSRKRRVESAQHGRHLGIAEHGKPVSMIALARVVRPQFEECGDEVGMPEFIPVLSLLPLICPQEGQPWRWPKLKPVPKVRLIPAEGVKLRNVEKRLLRPVQFYSRL
jgi:hypothetical protein